VGVVVGMKGELGPGWKKVATAGGALGSDSLVTHAQSLKAARRASSVRITPSSPGAGVGLCGSCAPCFGHDNKHSNKPDHSHDDKHKNKPTNNRLDSKHEQQIREQV
jgi:hypothetical protein